ncbi:MAG: hypothetical protein ABI880_01870 [Acidobacteriota bacterium]
MLRGCFFVLALGVAVPAWAQQLSLDIRDGLVTMSATNVPVRQVLEEWAKVGGTRVIGAERVSGPALTLSLEGVPEGKALDIILRGAAGFMAAARTVPGTGRSVYDRIMVLATSTPPAGGNAAGAAGAAGRPAANRFGVPTAATAADTSDAGVNDTLEMNEQPQVNPFANAFGQPGMPNPFGQPAQAVPFGQPAQGNPFGQAIPQQPFQPGGNFFQPLQPATGVPTAPPGTGFFGAGGSVTPGMIQQAPQQVPPGTRPRPPG